MRFLPRLLLTTLLAITLAACAPAAGGTPTPGSTPTPTAPISQTPIAHPSGRGDVVFQWSRMGGFVPRMYLDLWVPSFTLYGDGTLIYARYDEKDQVTRLHQAKLSEAAMQELLDYAVNTARLFGSKGTYFNPYIADAPTTTFVLRAGGRDAKVTAYGLMQSGLHQKPQGWTQADMDQWERLGDLQEYVEAIDLRGSTNPNRQDLGVYRANAVTLYVERSQGSAGPNTPQWPVSDLDLEALAPPINRVSEGTLVEGDLAGKVLDAVPLQTSKTFLHKGMAYQVGIRPRLPYDWTWGGGLPPHVTSVSPASGAQADAALKDGLCIGFHFQSPTRMGNNPTSLIKVQLDGADISKNVLWMSTKDLPPSQGRGCYTPTTKLSSGEHAVTLSYTDEAGTSYRYDWKFFMA